MSPSASHQPNASDRPEHPLRQILWDITSTIVPALVIALVLNTYVARATTIIGPSMQPNLHTDQRVLLDKATYRFIHGPQRGDVVVIDLPGEEIPLIKRVIGLPGETVEIRQGQVFINGEPLEEPWETQSYSGSYPATYVPPLYVFVLGDNRANSRDSRSFGVVPIEWLTARALFVYWPPDQAETLR